SRWETLPWKARPALDRICFHLRTNEECTDLANFSVVCKSFRNVVKEFMMRKTNRCGLKLVNIMKTEASMEVEIFIFPSNIAFLDLATLDGMRIERSINSGFPTLRVKLTGFE
ncbi:hypothetical protein PMAYCL1PPCAC_26989, partial [Pristionchus mayeri]